MSLLCDAITFEVYDQFALSAEQVNAGEEIIKSFIEDAMNTRWIVLLAQMQSGKTETYLFVCLPKNALNLSNNLISKPILLSCPDSKCVYILRIAPDP